MLPHPEKLLGFRTPLEATKLRSLNSPLHFQVEAAVGMIQVRSS